MSLHQDIKDQIKEAMKARDTVRLGVIRGLVASFTNELISLKRMPDGELSNQEALNIIGRAVKQRKDSIEQFTKGRREDLADNERSELRVLETYLPPQMPREEVMKIAKAKIAKMGVVDPSTDSHSSPSDARTSESRTGQAKSKTGMFMGALMKELKGKADGDIVKSVVEELLQ